MKLIKCECCGGNQLKKNFGNSLMCSFCESIYILDENENIMSKEITDVKVMSLFLDAEKCRKTKNHMDKKAAECINQAERMGYAYVSKARKEAGLSLFSKFF